MTDLKLRASRIQLAALVAALLVAVLIAAAITTGAFVLSFAVQRDLARQALIPDTLTWIFPAIVDGAILGATIAIVAMSKIGGNISGKRFYLALAVAVVAISVFGNAFHAYKAATDLHQRIASGSASPFVPLSPTGAALVAIIPPLLVLAFTHGIGVLVKAIGTAYSEYQDATRTDRSGDEDPTVATDTDARTSRQHTNNFVVSDALISVHTPAHTDATTTGTTAAVVARDIVAHRTDQPSAETVRVAEGVVDDVSGVAEGNTDTEINLDTVVSVLQFVEQSDQFDDDPGVRATARLRLTEPNLTWAEIAARTDVRAASTALRRWGRAKDAIAGAGFILDDNRLPMQEQLQVRELVAP